MEVDFDFITDAHDVMSSPVVSRFPTIDFDFDPSKFDAPYAGDTDPFDLASTFQTFSQPSALPMEQLRDEFRIELSAGLAASRPRARSPQSKELSSPAIFKPFASIASAELTVKGLRTKYSKEVSRSLSLPVAVGFNL
jgi:hypothetical protein